MLLRSTTLVACSHACLAWIFTSLSAHIHWPSILIRRLSTHWLWWLDNRAPTPNSLLVAGLTLPTCPMTGRRWPIEELHSNVSLALSFFLRWLLFSYFNHLLDHFLWGRLLLFVIDLSFELCDLVLSLELKVFKLLVKVFVVKLLFVKVCLLGFEVIL